MSPARRIGRKVAALTLVYLGALAPLVLLFNVLDGGASIGDVVLSVASLLLPLSLAAASAQVFATARIDGEWDLDSLLGYSPAARIAPVFASAALVAVFTLLAAQQAPLSGLSAGGSGPWALPAPVEATASLWLGEGDWSRPDLGAWMSPPGTLTLPALWARATTKAPIGSRRGVDRAELIRRLGWSIALPLAVLLGARAGRRCVAKRREPGSPVLGAVVTASAGLLSWLLAVLLLAAYLSSTM